MGVVQQLCRGPGGHDPSIEQHGDAVPDPEGGGHVVGDDHRGHAEVLGRLADHLVDVLGGDGVESRGRFIVKQNLRSVDQRARQADAFSHTARELRWKLLLDAGHVGQIQPAQQLAHPLDDLFLGQPVALQQRERDVLHHRHRIEQGGVLEHHPELAPQPSQLDLVLVDDVLPVDVDVPGFGLHQPHQVLHQHRLALPRAADDDVDLAPFDVEIHAPQDMLGTERLVQVAHLDVPARIGRAVGLDVGFGAHDTNGQMAERILIRK